MHDPHQIFWRSLHDVNISMLWFFALMMFVITLWGGTLLLPRAWQRLDVRSRALSLTLLAGMVAVTVLSFGVAMHATDAAGELVVTQPGLVMVFLALFYWAIGPCEWGLPKAKAVDLVERHERRVQVGVFGAGFALMGVGYLVPLLANAAVWLQLLLSFIGITLCITLMISWLLNKRVRMTLLRWF